jgi:hypothetical protein
MNQPWITGLVTLLYLAEAVRLYFNGQVGFSLTFLGYSMANVGLIWAMMVGAK